MLKSNKIYVMLRPCHTTTYSTNVCRRMKNSASALVYAEYVRNKFETRYEHAAVRWYTLAYDPEVQHFVHP